MIKGRIAAVVVTYNRKVLLKECLDGLLKQTHPLDIVIVIDNASTDGTADYLKQKGYLDNPVVDYVCLSGNIGGAGGFHEGMKRAYEKGFDWIWVMDDDAEPLSDALEKLVIHFSDTGERTAFASMKVNADGKYLLRHVGNINIDTIVRATIFPLREDEVSEENKAVPITFCSFVGLMVPSSIVKAIGFPRKDYFIYHDDYEYCIRISKLSHINLICSSKIVHKEAPNVHAGNEKKKFLLFTSHAPRVPIGSYWRIYYAMRNLCYTAKKYQKKRSDIYFWTIEYCLKVVAGIIMYDDKKWIRINLIIKAFIDGFMGRLGIRIYPNTVGR